MENNHARPGNEREHLLSALLVDALHHRQADGQTTTLRDLHGLLDVPQPVALRLARELELKGVATIESHLTDAFASQITLSSRTMSHLERTKAQRPRQVG